METKVYKTKLGKLKHMLDFQCLFTVDSIGHGGGLALMWKDDIPLEIHSFSQRHINCWITTPTSESPWMFTCSYEHPVTYKRVEGNNILHYLHSLQPLMWLCLRDFNEILFHSEKFGGARRSGK